MKLNFGIAVICASFIALSSGARYIGNSARDAGKILDNSQGFVSVGTTVKGIPRAYAFGDDTGRQSVRLNLKIHSKTIREEKL